MKHAIFYTLFLVLIACSNERKKDEDKGTGKIDPTATGTAKDGEGTGKVEPVVTAAATNLVGSCLEKTSPRQCIELSSIGTVPKNGVQLSCSATATPSTQFACPDKGNYYSCTREEKSTIDGVKLQKAWYYPKSAASEAAFKEKCLYDFRGEFKP